MMPSAKSRNTTKVPSEFVDQRLVLVVELLKAFRVIPMRILIHTGNMTECLVTFTDNVIECLGENIGTQTKS